MANSVVPKFTIVMGNSSGAGNYAMCGRAFDPRLILAWPGSKMAVMGGEQAAKVLLQIEKSKLKKEGEKIDPKKEKDLLKKIKSRYDKQTQAYYAAARLWTDAIIDPVETRKWISIGIDAANHAPVNKRFNMGLLQV
jgi:acetyl-CoA carboxylase carboxyltransferase component